MLNLTADQKTALNRCDLNELADKLREIKLGDVLDKLPDYAAATELTIASGAITVTQDAHRVDTESDAASDDLDTISGGVAEQVLFLRPENGARTVVIRHIGGGSGNIYCPGGKDISLADATDFAVLVYANSKWTVVAYNVLAVAATITQTYATADATHANPTSADLTDNSGGAAADGTIAAINVPAALTDNSGGAVADGTIGAIGVPAALTDNSGGAAADGTIGAIDAGVHASVKDAIAELATKANAQRTSMVALTDAVAELAAKSNAQRTSLTALTDAIAEVADQHNKLRADVLDVKALLNSVIDALQARGILG